ncbi:PilZ domain-containing protein [Hyphomicrobium sp.]|uniref:PilZ domain-containing protein n=1 Tax=Hyphomicrobium sp. TaxID=82 RepID=UPI0035674169
MPTFSHRHKSASYLCARSLTGNRPSIPTISLESLKARLFAFGPNQVDRYQSVHREKACVPTVANLATRFVFTVRVILQHGAAASTSCSKKMQVGKTYFNRSGILRATLAIERSKDQPKFGKRSAFKPADLVFDDGQRIAGTVLELSDGGAKIKVSDPQSLKGEFYLEIPSDDLSIRCRVVHIQDGIVDLQSVKPPRRLSWIKK